MGTNYYRIPSAEEMESRKKYLIDGAKNLELTVENILHSFELFDSEDEPFTYLNIWDLFLNDVKVHIGKRSSGWKFLWNFNDKKYYSNKEQLERFILSGRIVNEYGEELKGQEFLDMAYNWCVDGDDLKSNAIKNPQAYRYGLIDEEWYIDGLRTSGSTEFS